MASFPLWSPAFFSLAIGWPVTLIYLDLFLPGADGRSLTCRKVDIYHLLGPAALLFMLCRFTAWGKVLPVIQ